MTTLLDMEKSIADFISEVLEPTGFKVEAFPERPKEYTFTHPIGVVLVAYEKTNFGNPLATDYISQDLTHSFGMVILARNLRSHQGAYNVIDLLRKNLTGFIPVGGDKSWVDDIQFLGQSESLWQYGMSLSVPAVNFEEVYDGGPLLKTATINSPIVNSLTGEMTTLEIP